jgi:hypothetical protein
MLAEIEPRGFFRRVRVERVVAQVGEQLRSAAVKAFPELAPYARVLPGGLNEVLVRLHPADEEVRLAAQGDRILLSARTNGAGPGYHQFLVSLMDVVAGACLLRWLPECEEGGEVYQDETGYFESRQADALQREMARWLATVASQMTECDTDDNVYLLSMPLGTPLPSGFEGALAPVGRFSIGWLRETAETSGAKLLARAAGFFPWWEPGVNEHARVGVGRTALWRFPWHPPTGEEETALAEVAVACLGSAPSNLGPGGTLSRRDIEELVALMTTAADAARPPSATGFGFLRANVRRNPFPGCSIEVPGYFYEKDDEDDGAKIYWFGDRVVRIVSWLVTRDGGPTPATPRDLVEHSTAFKPGRGRPASRFAIEAPPLSGYCVLLDVAEGESLRHAHAVIERPGRMLLLTISFAAETDARWVESVVRSSVLLAPEGH